MFLGCVMVRFEPQPGSPRRLAYRVLQIIEPVVYADTSMDSSEFTPTEGSLLCHPKTGQLVTLNIDAGPQRQAALSPLWPDSVPSPDPSR